MAIIESKKSIETGANKFPVRGEGPIQETDVEPERK